MDQEKIEAAVARRGRRSLWIGVGFMGVVVLAVSVVTWLAPDSNPNASGLLWPLLTVVVFIGYQADRSNKKFYKEVLEALEPGEEFRWGLVGIKGGGRTVTIKKPLKPQ